MVVGDFRNGKGPGGTGYTQCSGFVLTFSFQGAEAQGHLPGIAKKACLAARPSPADEMILETNHRETPPVPSRSSRNTRMKPAAIDFLTAWEPVRHCHS